MKAHQSQHKSLKPPKITDTAECAVQISKNLKVNLFRTGYNDILEFC